MIKLGTSESFVQRIGPQPEREPHQTTPKKSVDSEAMPLPPLKMSYHRLHTRSVSRQIKRSWIERFDRSQSSFERPSGLGSFKSPSKKEVQEPMEESVELQSPIPQPQNQVRVSKLEANVTDTITEEDQELESMKSERFKKIKLRVLRRDAESGSQERDTPIKSPRPRERAHRNTLVTAQRF